MRSNVYGSRQSERDSTRTAGAAANQRRVGATCEAHAAAGAHGRTLRTLQHAMMQHLG